ncbi:uncharacterized protein CTRU02_207918 [Colletotrichum truncatum]|uniref:Uncharacterized protein n=1 Tax=Colletotrichum truncatum TaxID=5467 RepID=A0ACC3Z259_COLTU|nr:uncharacterized protein CTRU02_14861 [Colletotrichum truncatum]KAF6781662.1 hypothetical protein CTRU02_14861 [Colletotrichum truncatum]
MSVNASSLRLLMLGLLSPCLCVKAALFISSNSIPNENDPMHIMPIPIRPAFVTENLQVRRHADSGAHAVIGSQSYNYKLTNPGRPEHRL